MPELTINAPEGAHFNLEEVRTKNGTVSLGEQPILEWDSLDGAFAHYGQGVLLMVNGTSGKVSFQGIARRMAAAGKNWDEIATAQVAFKPGTKSIAPTTPQGRAAKAARSVAEKVDGDALTKLLERIDADPSLLARLSE
jgi:hypothetical protein